MLSTQGSPPLTSSSFVMLFTQCALLLTLHLFLIFLPLPPHCIVMHRYALMPQMLRDYMASREYNPDKICVFAASDDGNTVLALDGAPEMRCAYWSYKKLEEGYANMYVAFMHRTRLARG